MLHQRTVCKYINIHSIVSKAIVYQYLYRSEYYLFLSSVSTGTGGGLLHIQFHRALLDNFCLEGGGIDGGRIQT